MSERVIVIVISLFTAPYTLFKVLVNIIIIIIIII